MTEVEFAILAVAGVLGGGLNAMAAGGGVVTMLACLAVGMPVQVAVATSQVAIPASFVGAVRPVWRQRRRFRPILPAVLAAAVGTALGVWLVSRLDAHTFRLIAPWLLVIAGALLVFQSYLPRLLGHRNRDLLAVTAQPGGEVRPSRPHTPGEVGDLGRREPADLGSRRRLVLAAGLFTVSLYGGGFGGGVGVAVLLVLATLLTGWTWEATNTVKNGLCLVMSTMGSAAFLLTGLANLPAVAVLAAGQLAGGALGVWAFKFFSEHTLRRIVAVAAVAGAIGSS